MALIQPNTYLITFFETEIDQTIGTSFGVALHFMNIAQLKQGYFEVLKSPFELWGLNPERILELVRTE